MIINSIDLNGKSTRVNDVLGAELGDEIDPSVRVEGYLEALERGMNYGDYTQEEVEAIIYRLATTIGRTATADHRPLD